jgi:hypothetical protein
MQPVPDFNAGIAFWLLTILESSDGERHRAFIEINPSESEAVSAKTNGSEMVVHAPRSEYRCRNMTESIGLGQHRYGLDVIERSNRTGHDFKDESPVKPPEKLRNNKAGSNNSNKRDSHGP